MGEQDNRVAKRTHSLFVDNLKVHQESHNALKNVNEINVQASHETEPAMECQSVRKSYSKWEDGERKRSSGAGGKNEDHGPR